MSDSASEISAADLPQYTVVARRELDLSIVRLQDPERKHPGLLHGNGIFSATVGNVPDDVDTDSLYFGVVLRAVERLSPTEWRVKAVLIEDGESVAQVLEEFDRSVASGSADVVSNDIIDVSNHG